MRQLRSIAAIALTLLLAIGAWAGAVYWRSVQPYPVASVPAGASGPLQPLARSTAAAPNDRVLVMLVFDGLSARSIASVPTPHFARLAAEGSHTGAMLPVYPTLSMPNHVSLSTGCYPEHHGIVSNRFIDPERGLYEHDKGDTGWQLGCEPINVVAERQGVRSAILGWVGATHGRQALASIVEEHRSPEPGIAQRSARVLELLSKPDGERPQLIVAYFTEPDQSLHAHGFDGAKSKTAMRDADTAVGQVLDAIERSGLRQRAMLLVTSDHGMVDAIAHVNVERILRDEDINGQIAADGATAHVYLDDPRTRDAALAKLQKHAHMIAFLPERPPPYAHIGESKRLGDIVIETAPGYYVFDRGLWPKNVRWAALYGPELLTQRTFKGMHGYPPETPGVQSVFYAWGAGIAHDAALTGMQSIDVHPTIAALLGIQPSRSIDGHARNELLAQK